MGKRIDLTNQRFGFWQVIKESGKNKSGQFQYLCKCDCGTEKIISGNSLKSCNSTSCGCRKGLDIINKTFGKLTVVKPDYSKGRKYWLTKCECGSELITSGYKLKEKLITSCGCDKIKKFIKSSKEVAEKLFVIVLGIVPIHS